MCYTYYPHYHDEILSLNEHYSVIYSRKEVYIHKKRTIDLNFSDETIKKYLIAMKFRNIQKIYWKDGYLLEDGTLVGTIPSIFLV